MQESSQAGNCCQLV